MGTAADVVNEALQLICDSIQAVTGIPPTFDSSTPGKAAAQLYTATVTAVGWGVRVRRAYDQASRDWVRQAVAVGVLTIADLREAYRKARAPQRGPPRLPGYPDSGTGQRRLAALAASCTLTPALSETEVSHKRLVADHLQRRTADAGA